MSTGLSELSEAPGRKDRPIDGQVLEYGELDLAAGPDWESEGQRVAHGACCVWMLLRCCLPKAGSADSCGAGEAGRPWEPYVGFRHKGSWPAGPGTLM